MKQMKKLEKGTYIIGVSGGPDSMALLDMCRKEGFQLVVAHMNYKKRDTADRDMELVRSYCARFHIPFEARLQTKPCVGNFQAFAREERYRMYRELLQKYQAAAVLLAHYYVPAEVQEIADYVGDSFYLSKVASKLTNKVLVFCGVSFMGESGKLLNPDKAVLMPDASADCPMAHMVTKAEIDDVRARYEDLAVVCYINSTAEIKSWSDVCVTSANAVQIVKKLPNQNILFIPDKNLGRYVAEQVPEKNVMLVKGYCPVHEEMKVKEIQELKQLHPQCDSLEALFMEVIAHA